MYLVFSNLESQVLLSKIPRLIQFKRSILLLLIVSTFSAFTACSNKKPPTSTPTPTQYVIVTSMAARLDGKLVEEFDGCLRVRDYALVWPPDIKMTIDNGNILIISGIVSGDIREVVLSIGEMITLSGGISNQLDEQLQNTIPRNCTGPYWIVGATIKPLEE